LALQIGDVGHQQTRERFDHMTLMAQWMLPPEYLDPQYGSVTTAMDLYHAGLVLRDASFEATPHLHADQVLAGFPRQIAEGLSSPYGAPIAHALRRLFHIIALPPRLRSGRTPASGTSAESSAGLADVNDLEIV